LCGRTTRLREGKKTIVLIESDYKRGRHGFRWERVQKSDTVLDELDESELVSGYSTRLRRDLSHKEASTRSQLPNSTINDRPDSLDRYLGDDATEFFRNTFPAHPARPALRSRKGDYVWPSEWK
jgi:hypothetical protein